MTADVGTRPRAQVVSGLAALAVSLVLAGSHAFAQAPSSDLSSRVLATVRAALTPALPYPPTDDAGELPADNSPNAPWMVRPIIDGDLTIEVLANPLNVSNQSRAAKAMVQIEAAIQAAQRRSQASYEKAVADARRTGRSQDVDGITLGDEGVAGARIDAEGHVTIAVEFNRPAYSFTVSSSIEPAALRAPVTGAVAAISVPANVYREGRDTATDERFCAAETHVFFGAIATPEVHRRSNTGFETTATSIATTAQPSDVRSAVVSLRGNGQLIDQIVRLADWTRVHGLVTGK
ncbi:MAG: hypothetical protein ACRD2N_09775 [Vicinamibacterales bacterium]